MDEFNEMAFVEAEEKTTVLKSIPAEIVARFATETRTVTGDIYQSASMITADSPAVIATVGVNYADAYAAASVAGYRLKDSDHELAYLVFVRNNQ